MIFSTAKFITYTRALGRLAPNYIALLLGLIPKRIIREHRATWQIVSEKLQRRRETKIDYTDFSTSLINAEQKGTIVAEDLVSNLPVLVVAGSETTATALSGSTYYVLKNPRVYALLKDEIRSNFCNHDEINLSRVNELKYLNAVIDEGLRMYPPANSNHPRVVSHVDAFICGRHVPRGTLVGIPHYGCFRSPFNFADPEEFVPERWLDKSDKYAHDNRDAVQPFHVGPRNCIGRK
jgi:cytochrome P450